MKNSKTIDAIDLFCGAGGLTHGLQRAGINVLAGFDLDPACAFPYEANNSGCFIEKNIEDVHANDLEIIWSGSNYRLLAGCAPCQPFSTYQQGPRKKEDNKWSLLGHFSRLVEEAKPDFVTMENVHGLERHPIFADFKNNLTEKGYYIDFRLIRCSEYGIPQQRVRLVLVASRFGPIEIIPPTHKGEKERTVRDAIFTLPPLKAGQANRKDPLHQASSLSELNMKRMLASTPGGTWRDWQEDLIADCHKKGSGKTYPSVYGRMSWDEPAPTITTQFYGFGNGRFGHPEQNRALSLREGAILQSFPRWYKFVPPDKPVYCKTVGRLIGNAVPVRLGVVIGRSFQKHLVKLCN